MNVLYFFHFFWRLNKLNIILAYLIIQLMIRRRKRITSSLPAWPSTLFAHILLQPIFLTSLQKSLYLISIKESASLCFTTCPRLFTSYRSNHQMVHRALVCRLISDKQPQCGESLSFHNACQNNALMRCSSTYSPGRIHFNQGPLGVYKTWMVWTLRHLPHRP